MTKSLCSFLGLAQEEPQSREIQVGKLTKSIQHLQIRVIELELQVVISTPQEVLNQREEIANSTLGRIRELTSECKKLSDCSA
jgi:hypothetical protein